MQSDDDRSEKSNENPETVSNGFTFLMTVKPVGDRALARQVAKLSRPWEARGGEVYAIERRVDIDEGGETRFHSSEVGYWKKSLGGMSDMAVSLFDLPMEEVKRISPLVVYSLEDNRHMELITQHIKYHHETRSGSSGFWPPRTYICLSFWGGALIIEESAFEDFNPNDDMLPRLPGGFGFGFIWREVSRNAVSDAYHDADIMLGKYISDRLYPGLPEPVPVGRGFGARPSLEDHLLF